MVIGVSLSGQMLIICSNGCVDVVRGIYREELSKSSLSGRNGNGEVAYYVPQKGM